MTASELNKSSNLFNEISTYYERYKIFIKQSNPLLAEKADIYIRGFIDGRLEEQGVPK